MRLTDMKTLRSVAVAVAMALPFAALTASAQRAQPAGSGDTFKDTSMIKPAPGVRVAIIEFQDLECPACAHAFPVVHAAVAHYNLPLAEHDFPLRQHIWSFDAAVWARYLQDKFGMKLADEYRGAVFAAQTGIESKDDMVTFTRKFFASHGMQMPFVPDPAGQFTKEVEADRALGEKVGLQHTPTIFVCTAHEWVQVTNVDDLYQTIDELEAKAGPAAKASTAKRSTVKKASTH